jgi:hypothetical protein
MSPERARYRIYAHVRSIYPALSGLEYSWVLTQGVALGWYIADIVTQSDPNSRNGVEGERGVERVPIVSDSIE